MNNRWFLDEKTNENINLAFFQNQVSYVIQIEA